MGCLSGQRRVGRRALRIQRAVALGVGRELPHLDVQLAAELRERVRVAAGDKMWSVHVTSTPGMSASMPPVAHIGLGEVSTIDWIELDIPWLGKRSLLGPIDARQHVSFVEPTQ